MVQTLSKSTEQQIQCKDAKIVELQGIITKQHEDKCMEHQQGRFEAQRVFGPGLGGPADGGLGGGGRLEDQYKAPRGDDAWSEVERWSKENDRLRKLLEKSKAEEAKRAERARDLVKSELQVAALLKRAKTAEGRLREKNAEILKVREEMDALQRAGEEEERRRRERKEYHLSVMTRYSAPWRCTLSRPRD